MAQNPFELNCAPCLGFPHFPGEIIPMLIVLTVKNCPLVSKWDLPRGNLCHYPLSFPCDSLYSPHPLCSHPSDTGTWWQCTLSLLVSRLTQLSSLSLSCAGSSLWPFWAFSSLSFCVVGTTEHNVPGEGWQMLAGVGQWLYLCWESPCCCSSASPRSLRLIHLSKRKSCVFYP